MSPEEADGKIEFILQMQAQFEANLGKLRDSQATLTASVVRIAEILEESIKHTDVRFAKADERSARVDQHMAELAEAQKATGERLNALINIVERHITGPDHGRKRR